MEELPRALIKERMVTVKVIVMVNMMIVTLEKVPPTREFAVSVTHLEEEPGSKISKRASLIKFNQV